MKLIEEEDENLLRTYSVRKVRERRRTKRDKTRKNKYKGDKDDEGYSEGKSNDLLPRALHHKNLIKLLETVQNYEEEDENENLKESDKKLTEEITLELLQTVDSVWESDPHDEVSVINGHHCKVENIQTLRDGEWVDDVVVNCYLQLVAARSVTNPKMPKTLALDALFYPMLCNGGYSLAKDFTAERNIFEAELVFVPIHSDEHWSLVCINTAQKSIVYLDSMEHQNEKCMRDIYTFLYEEHKRLFNQSLPQNWKIEFHRKHPRQKNFNDCGIFMLLYAEHIARRNWKFEFSSEFIPLYRRRTCYEIKIGYLLRRRYAYKKLIDRTNSTQQKAE